MSLAFSTVENVLSLAGKDGFEMRSGNLLVRLARNAGEVEEAQRLRYRVFCEEMGAFPSTESLRLRRDFDEFDLFCDHLLVIDENLPQHSLRVVGTYRLLRRESMSSVGRFYTESEFDIAALKRQPQGILELGRSCVASPYRNRVAMQLLWRGISAYIMRYDIRYMFGCASFPGIQADAYAEELSYLYHHHLAPAGLRPHALSRHHVPMDILPKDRIDARTVFTRLPALIKGYLRVGSWVGDGAVIDHQYNTTDVAMVISTTQFKEQYMRRYEYTRPEHHTDDIA